MSVHDIVSHPVFLGWWGAFGVDFWAWMKDPDWTLDGFNLTIASKRWLVGVIMGLFAWLGLGAL